MLDLDNLDIDEAMAAQDELIESHDVEVVHEESVLDDLDTMEAFLQSVAVDEQFSLDDLEI